MRHLESTAAAIRSDKTGWTCPLNVKWTDEEDKALSTAVAAHINTETGAVDWKEVQKTLRPILPRRTVHDTSDNLRTRWRGIGRAMRWIRPA